MLSDSTLSRKWGKKTAHVGKQWLSNIGKTDNGVVSVSTLWADEGVYWPQDFEPYTPAHHFKGGKNDPKFRTKLKIARELVMQAVEEGILFRAVVADSFYGEDEELRWTLRNLGAGYVLALKPSHDRRAVGGRPGRGVGGSALARRVGKGRAPFQRWAHRRVVGAGGGGWSLWPPQSPASTRGHHRPRKAAREEDIVPAHPPAPSLTLGALGRGPSGRGRACGGGTPLRA